MIIKDFLENKEKCLQKMIWLQNCANFSSILIFYEFFHENIKLFVFWERPENQTTLKIEKKERDLYNQSIIKSNSLTNEFEVKIQKIGKKINEANYYFKMFLSLDFTDSQEISTFIK